VDVESRIQKLAFKIVLSVIIVSWNVRDLLRECLHSLVADLTGLESRIIVVDSASGDDTPAIVRAEFPQIELIAREDNIGYVKGNNLALREILNADHSQFNNQLSKFVWLLNPDTVIHPGATKALIEFMQTHPKCGLCGPKLLNPDRSLQHGAFALPGLTQLMIDTVPRLQARFRNTTLDGRYPPAKYDGPPFPIGTPLGAAMFARAEAIAQVGLLDEGYEMYSEEIDWAMRMHRAGWQVWCVPQARVTHYGGASSSQASERAERHKWHSRQRYFNKYYGPLKRRLAMTRVPAQYRE
jgi:GT2 family glycosyltransferase